MLLKSKKNTSHVQPKVKKTRKTKKKDILPEAESFYLNQTVLNARPTVITIKCQSSIENVNV
jgi:hypothetical protein